MKETHQEKIYKKEMGLPDFSEFNLSYQECLLLVNSHLKTIYGDRANLDICLNDYFQSNDYRKACHNGTNVEDIKLLESVDIERMLVEEKQYSSLVEDLERYYKIFKATSSDVENKKYLYKIASILGVLPENADQTLFSWILQKKELTIHEKDQLNKKIDDNIQLLNIITETLSRLFIPGLLLKFPSTGIVMTQQRCKYYFRGENAFYKTSKASIYRNKSNLPPEIKDIVDLLRRDECGFFLDKFNAIKDWNCGYGNVNNIALMQHYGLQTQLIDITSDLKTALFFACCKFGKDRKWHPLQKTEIAQINSREDIVKLGGDSRYGILYRTPTEITDIKWALADENAGFEIITPVGYQPFMRCSTQHSYMMIARDKNYDMLCNPLFDIYKIRLDEDFCRWIYEQMDFGNKVYPNDDVPDITREIEKFNNQTIFSESIFQNIVNERRLNDNAIRNLLSRHGILVIGKQNYIDPERLKKINMQYTFDIVLEKIGIEPKMSPLIIIS